MSIVAWLLLLSASAADGDSIELLRLPLRLEDEFPQEQRLENAPVEKPGRQDEFGARRDDDDMVFSLAARVRFSIPFGAAHRNYSNYYYGYYYVENYTSWSDLFNPGWGFEMEADFFLGGNKGPGRRRSPGTNYGFMLLFQTDQYTGRSENGATGTHLSLDDMTATTIQIGGRVIHASGPDVYFGGAFGLGAVHYTEVEGTFTGPGVLIPSRDKVFRDTYTFASTFRGDAGYKLGPIALTAGMSLRIMAPPQEGSNFDMDSGAFWTFDLHLGAEIGF